MKLGQIRKSIFAAATALSVVCLFAVPFNARDRHPRRLFPAILKLVSGSDFSGAFEFALYLATAAVILFTALLPLALWMELTHAKRPLSRGMRTLLIVQGIVGIGGVVLTFILMSINMAYFGFGNETDPAAPGFTVIIVSELAYCAASAAFGSFPRLIQG